MNEKLTPTAYEAASEPIPDQANPPQRILVVDDDPGILQLNTILLSDSGYDVSCAEDGAAAWKTLNSSSYDLLVTDNNMPHVTGIELLTVLRAAGMILPVIMATGSLPTEQLSRSPWLKPAAVLLKPYGSGELVRTVKEVLRESSSTGKSTSMSKGRDVPASRWEAGASAKERCGLQRSCIAEWGGEESAEATGPESSPSEATSPPFKTRVLR